MRSEPASGAGSLVLLSGGPVGGMLMGKEGPLCGLPWPVCPLDLDQRLSSRAGTARCPVCYRRWPLDEVVPCPAGAGAAVGPGRHERVVCRSHAAHPSMARLVAIEEDSP
jgi:hypothetical protein